jgi:vitamin-K-epoxide reductase (warfarin-sensitive)
MDIVALRIVASVGFLLATYAIYVERKLQKNAAYQPVCDIGNKVSCKAAFNSEYGKFLGISNAIFGIIFYTAFIATTYTQFTILLWSMSIASVLGSIYLAYISYIKLRNLCIVCTATYLVNTLLLIFIIF